MGDVPLLKYSVNLGGTGFPKYHHFQWSFLVPLIGGRWYIIPQLAVYTTYIPLIYCLLGDYISPIPPIKGTRNSCWHFHSAGLVQACKAICLQGLFFFLVHRETTGNPVIPWGAQEGKNPWVFPVSYLYKRPSWWCHDVSICGIFVEFWG